MSTRQALKRLAQEHEKLQNDPPETFTAGPANDDNPLHWVGTVNGPPDTPYAHGTFSIDIRFPEIYPREHFQLTFTTPVYHPNISLNGEVFLPELNKNQWSPACTVRTILLSLQAMMSDPIPIEDFVLNEEAAGLYLEDFEKFKEKAAEWTTSYATKV